MFLCIFWCSLGVKSPLRCGENRQNMKTIRVDKKLNNLASNEANGTKIHMIMLEVIGHVRHKFGPDTITWHKLADF